MTLFRISHVFAAALALALPFASPLASSDARAEGAAAPAAVEWTIDGSHSSAAFGVKHLMISNTRGEFRKVEGKVVYDGKDVSKAQIEVSIDAASIDTHDEKRDQHLKSPDFFDVEKFAKLTFKSKKVEKAGGKLKITGDLTIKDVTKEVVLTADALTAETKDPWGFVRIATHATTKVNRKDFGLTWNKALDGGGVVVGDEVAITLDVELMHKAQ